MFKLAAVSSRLGAVGQTLLKAGQAMHSMLMLWNTHGTHMPPEAVQSCFDFWKRFCSLTEDVPDVQVPKRHIMVHLLSKIHFFGNPRRYANWLDESLNKELKKCCRTVSQSTFEPFLLLRMREVLSQVGSKRKSAM